MKKKTTIAAAKDINSPFGLLISLAAAHSSSATSRRQHRRPKLRWCKRTWGVLHTSVISFMQTVKHRRHSTYKKSTKRKKEKKINVGLLLLSKCACGSDYLLHKVSESADMQFLMLPCNQQLNNNNNAGYKEISPLLGSVGIFKGDRELHCILINKLIDTCTCRYRRCF